MLQSPLIGIAQMSFSYNFRPTLNKVDEVRFLVNDTSKETFLIHDEEVQYLLNKYQDNINAVCAAACEVMASAHAKKQEIAVSNYRQSTDSTYKKLLDRADRFRKNAITTEHIFSSAISAMRKTNQEENTDNVKPYFKSGLMDNPQAPQDPYEDSHSLT